jgi:hypothetical protein
LDHLNIDNKKKKLSCKFCNGIGLIKNTNTQCYICEGNKCSNSKNYTIHDNYPYDYCKNCLYTNNLYLKNYCLNCSNKGYVKNEPLICLDCDIEHKICLCQIYITPYTECNKCNGSGELN